MDASADYEGLAMEEGAGEVRGYDDHRFRELVFVPCMDVLGSSWYPF